MNWKNPDFGYGTKCLGLTQPIFSECGSEFELPRRHEVGTPPPKYSENQEISGMSLSVHLFPPPPDYREALKLSAK